MGRTCRLEEEGPPLDDTLRMKTYKLLLQALRQSRCQRGQPHSAMAHARCGTPAVLSHTTASSAFSSRLAVAGRHCVGAPAAAPRRLSSPALRSTSPVVTRAKLTKDGPHIAVVGTTGAVGQEFLNVRSGCALSHKPRASSLVPALFTPADAPICRSFPAATSRTVN